MNDRPPSPAASRARAEESLLERLDALRDELVELAYALELRGRAEAADVASGTAAKLGELRAEFDPAGVEKARPA
jgi:hypothetical protein